MCGIYGIFSYEEGLPEKDVHNVIKWLGIASMERGTHATGIAYLSKNHINIFKAPKPADKFKFKLPLGVKTIIGHTRHATQGHQKRCRNNHPWLGNTVAKQEFVLAHNGILFNDRELRKTKNLPETSIETDSYIAVQLLSKEKSISMESVKSMAETVAGSFVFTILDDASSLYIAKFNNPVSILHFKELKTYFYASTDTILWSGLVNSSLFTTIKSQFLKNPNSVEEIKLADGQILKIDSAGKIKYGEFKANEYYGFDFSGSYCFNSYYDRVYNSSFFAEEEYLEQIKAVALSLGHDSSIIDALLSEGFHFDEIEEFLYAECPPQEELESVNINY